MKVLFSAFAIAAVALIVSPVVIYKHGETLPESEYTCSMSSDITFSGERLTTRRCTYYSIPMSEYRYFAYSARLIGFCGPENRRMWANEESDFVEPCTYVGPNPDREIPREDF